MVIEEARRFRYMKLDECLAAERLDMSLAHWRRASLHMLMGNITWARRCYEKADKDLSASFYHAARGW